MFCCLVSDDPDRDASAVLDEIAHACSPRVQIDARAGRAVVFDASGLDRAIGTPAEIGAAVQQLAHDRGARVRVAVARTSVAAWLLAHARAGVTIATGDPAGALASLPLGWLAALPSATSGDSGSSGQRPKARGQSDTSVSAAPGPSAFGLGPDNGPRGSRSGRGPARNYRMAPGPVRATPDEVRRAAAAAAEREVAAVFERWGIRTLGDLARLPRGDIHARMGPAGVRLHQAACGEDAIPLVPDVEPARFVERLQLDWPIEGLEPLSFVLARMCETLSRALERADRGAVGLTSRLVLVSRDTHVRTLHLPAPMRDARVLRTLILLDLESHPPAAAIDAVEIELDVVAGRIVQGSLLARALPSPEDLATLIARLQALAGETRVGAPMLVDTHDDRRFAMRPFAPATMPDSRSGHRPQATGQSKTRSSSAPGPSALGPGPGARGLGPVLALRRIRRPIPARVRVERGLPMHVQPSSRVLPAGAVIDRAGPWRTSGHWWAAGDPRWDREEWDVEIAGGGCYRLARVRSTGHWEIDGESD